MGYEHDFLAAQKAYLTKIKDKLKDKEPSKELIHVIEEEKSHGLVKKLDQLKGKRYSEMNTALDVFEANRLAYIRRIGAQIAHDAVGDKLKSSLNKYADALGVIGDAFQEDCQKQRLAEMPPPAPPMPKPKAPAGNPTGVSAAAAAAVKIMLGKVSEGFRKLRQEQVDMTGEAEKYCIEQRKQIGVQVDMLQKGVKQAVVFSRGGQVREAAALKVAAQGQVNKINVLLTGMKKKCDSLEPFFKERILKPEVVAKNLRIDLPDADVKELAKIPAQHAKLLNIANAHAAAAGRLLEECQDRAEDAASLQSQIGDIAEGKDFGKLFMDCAAKMATRVKAILDKATGEAEKLQSTMIPGLAKNVKIVEDKAPADRVSGAQAYVNTSIRQVKLSMDECVKAQTTATALIESEKGKIPAEILKGQAGKSIEQSETLLKKLVTLNTSNTKTATPVLESADKLAK